MWRKPDNKLWSFKPIVRADSTEHLCFLWEYSDAMKEQVSFQGQTKGTPCALCFLFHQQAVLWGLYGRQDSESESSSARGMLPHTRQMLLLIHLFKCLQGTETWWELGQLEALCVEAVPFFAGDGLK